MKAWLLCFRMAAYTPAKAWTTATWSSLRLPLTSSSSFRPESRYSRPCKSSDQVRQQRFIWVWILAYGIRGKPLQPYADTKIDRFNASVIIELGVCLWYELSYQCCLYQIYLYQAWSIASYWTRLSVLWVYEILQNSKRTRFNSKLVQYLVCLSHQ